MWFLKLFCCAAGTLTTRVWCSGVQPVGLVVSTFGACLMSSPQASQEFAPAFCEFKNCNSRRPCSKEDPSLADFIHGKFISLSTSCALESETWTVLIEENG